MMPAKTPRSRSLRRALPLGALTLLAACGGAQTPAAPSGQGGPDLGAAYAGALQAEATDPASAGPYLDLVDQAAAHPDTPGALAAAAAGLDALVTGSPPGVEGSGPDAIAYRSRDLFAAIAGRLRHAWYASARPDAGPSSALPVIRGMIAQTLHEMALFVGDAGAAGTWAARRGCAQGAAVIGPLSATPLRSLDDPSPIAPTDPLADGYPGIPPFAAKAAAEEVHADQCQIDVNAASQLQGTRAVVVDLAVPRPEAVHLAFTSASAAVVEVGGVRALRRGFEAGGRPVTRFATVHVPAAGSVRLVARVAQKGDGNFVEIDAWGDDGAPIAARAPHPGDVAPVRASAAEEVEIAPAPGAHGTLLAAAGLLAVGDARGAEHLLEPAGEAGGRSPAVDLAYARALDGADDMPDNKIVEQSRGAIDRVLAAWPGSWEARIGHARATERRRGAGEGVTEALRELGASPDRVREASAGWDVMTAAYVALTARRTQLYDVAEIAYQAIAAKAPGAPLLAGVDARLHARTGADALAAACNGGLRKADGDCYDAFRQRGDFQGALTEIERLRRLRGAPDAMLEQELSVRILMGDRKGALSVYDSMSPGERRMLDAIGFAAGAPDPSEARARLARDRTIARDAPFALGPLVRALGLEPDPAPRLEEEGRKLVLADQRAAFLPGAGTAVLRHTERYGIDASGLLHFVAYDLRRVSGTTDVAQGSFSFSPSIEGRHAPRLLRKRIHKRDGRILLPDAAQNASQASDLSQLETGDYVEQIIEGWALPDDTGQLVIDTPDLLPERTSVREATIEIRRSTSVPFSVWSHPLLGAPEIRSEGEYKVSVWRLKDQPPRRIEDGVPKMERSVGVSIGTQTWAQVGRAFDEAIRALEDRDPYVSRWIAEAAGPDRTVGRALVDRIVAATGKKVKVAGGGDLSDVAAVFGGGAQRSTARTTLELGQGSRAWVIYRALRELGVKASVAIAETEPFSASPDFPPHVGRFRHPLVVAHLPDGDVWIDADVDGPPLPPGRISPELRGRTALLDTGAMVTVEGSSGELGDEVDVRLALDDKGDARGTFTVLLHGRAAQALADAFETVVGTERREVLRGVVLGWMPWADVDDVALSSGEGSWEVALRASVAVHGFGRPEGKDGKTWAIAGLEPVHIVYPHGSVGLLGATYASRGARQNALSIEQPLQYHYHRRIDLPAGAKIARAPDGVEVNDPHVQARRRVTAGPTSLEEDFTLSLPTGTIGASHYPAFVEKVQAIDDGFMAGTRVRVK
jgi:hypothetical protein